MEEWKDIKGYEGYYQISNYGNGRSVDRVVERLSRWGKIVKVHYKGIELVKNKVGAGYLRFDLCKNGIYDYRYIHQLVWETFVGEIPEGMEIDHIDTDKTNNSLSNLRLVDRSGNMRNPLTYVKFFVPCTEDKKRKISETSKGKHYSPETEFKKGYTRVW